MSSVRLGELMATRVPSVNPAKFKDEDFELWSIPAFDQGAPERLTGADIGSSKKVIQPGDVLLSRIVPHIRRSWVVSENTDGCRQIGSGEWMIFRSDRFDPDYLRHFLISNVFHPQLMQTVAGVGGSLLRARPEGVKDISLFLPPLDEQKRIAAILDQADELRRKRQRAIDRLGQLGQAIFHDMFGDLAQLARTKEFVDVATIQKSLVDPKLPEFRSELHVGPEHIASGSGAIAWRSVRTIEEDNVISGKNRFSEGDIIYSKIRPYLNKVALADRTGLCSADMYVIQPNDGQANAQFLRTLMMGRDFLAYAETCSNRANIPKLNRKQVEGYSFHCPSLEQQSKFAQRLDQITCHEKCVIASADKTESLFASLQHRAFQGDI